MNPFIGQIIMFGGNFAPRGWAFCEGQLLAIASHTALFSILGTTYGGDGRTTFALPDLKGRMAVSQGNGPGLSPFSLGEKTGNEFSTLLTQNLPQTNVTIGASTEDTNSVSEPGPSVVSSLPLDDTFIYNTNPNTTMRAGTIQGQNTQFSNQSPYLTVSYIIALQGTFPSRS